MAGKLKLIFSDFLRTLRQLWLEFIGGVFLALGVLFILAAIQEYRKYVRSSELGTGRFLVGLFSSVRSEEYTSELQSPDHLVCRRFLVIKDNTASVFHGGER